MKLLNATQLAAAIGRHRTYVSAMKRAGFLFSHGTLTTFRSACDWLAAMAVVAISYTSRN